MTDFVIGDHNYVEHFGHVVDGDMLGRGLVKRDYGSFPSGSYGTGLAMRAVNIPLIPEAEWPERIRDRKAAKAGLVQVRLTGNNGNLIPSLNQGQSNFCWAHSSTQAVQILRALAGLPYVPLSAFAVACKIKNFQNVGGWGALSLDFIAEHGAPDVKFWAQGSFSRSNDTAACWENAALHRVIEGWIDTADPVYSRTLARQQVGSLLLSDIPVIFDLGWWEHSVLGLDLVDGTAQVGVARAPSGKLYTYQELNQIWGFDDFAGGIGTQILNSWGDDWGDRGMGTLAGNKAWPDGAVAPRAVLPSLN